MTLAPQCSLCATCCYLPPCAVSLQLSLWSHDIFLCHFYCPTVRTVWWQRWDTTKNSHYTLLQGCAAHAAHFLLSLLTSILFIIFSGDDDAKSQMRLVAVWRHACMDVIHTKRENNQMKKDNRAFGFERQHHNGFRTQKKTVMAWWHHCRRWWVWIPRGKQQIDKWGAV